MGKNLTLSLIVLFSLCFGLSAQSGSSVTTATQTNATQDKKATINWLTFAELEQKHDVNPKPVFIDIYTDWCGWCKKLDRTTFADPSVVEYLNNNYYAVKFNAEAPEPITFGGETYNFIENGKRGYSELAYRFMNGRMSYPTLAFLTDKLEVLQPVPGYVEAITLEAILSYYKGQHYNTTPWDQYFEEFKTTKSN